jgi:hypothetical protein
MDPKLVALLLKKVTHSCPPRGLISETSKKSCLCCRNEKAVRVIVVTALSTAA